MLFDLRSRGRRRTVQASTSGSPCSWAAAWCCSASATGNGIGGLLNAFTGNGSSNLRRQIISSAEKTALKQTQKNPSDPAAWAALETPAGRTPPAAAPTRDHRRLHRRGQEGAGQATDAWQKYVSLTKSPDPTPRHLRRPRLRHAGPVLQRGQRLGDRHRGRSDRRQGFECLAMTAYAAKQTRKGDLAAAKATSLVPKASRQAITTQIRPAKTQPSAAQFC